MELFHFNFIQLAFLGGICVAILAGVLGPFVVQSKQAIASDMFAHLALAGIGVAVFFNLNPWWWPLPTLLITSTALWWLGKKNTYSPDSLSMFFLSGGLAIALAFVHKARSINFSFENYLFGSILTITTTDILVMLVSAFVVVSVVWKLWYPLLGATQQPQYLVPYNSRPSYVQLLFFCLLAISVWIGIKTVGGLLIGALLVIPTVSVRNWARSFRDLVFKSTIMSLISVLIGLTLAVYIDIPPSSMIIGVMITLFCIQEITRSFLLQNPGKH